METVQRYTWEDSLIEAQKHGRISNGALLLALKLARAINWEPKGNRGSGLYWKNEDALRDVGASRATYFRNRGSLFDQGFFIEVNGNLIPRVPESLCETNESLCETEKSLCDNPYTVDTYTVDTYTEDNTETVAGAPATILNSVRDSDSLKTTVLHLVQPSLNDVTPASLSNTDEEVPAVSRRDWTRGMDREDRELFRVRTNAGMSWDDARAMILEANSEANAW